MISRLGLVAALACFAAACGPEKAPAELTPAKPSDQPPAAKAVTFEPLSTTAISITGPIALSVEPSFGENAPPSMKMVTGTGVEFITELIPGGAEQAISVDWRTIFGEAMPVSGVSPPGGPSIDMHSIVKETVPKEAVNGGLCGAEPTSFIAMATGLESAGQSYMAIAAFGGDTWPPANADKLCGIFTYIPPALK